MKIALVSMATREDENHTPYVSIVLCDADGNEYLWNMYGDTALDSHFDIAQCVQRMREITAQQKRAQETHHGDFQYAEAQNGKHV